MEDLLTYYIGYRVREFRLDKKYLTSLGLLLRESQNVTPLHHALRIKCLQVEKTHEGIFRAAADELQDPTSICSVADQMMVDGGLNFGRLVVLIAYSGYLCNYLAQKRKWTTLVTIIENLYRFFKLNISPWVCANGGLESLQNFLIVLLEKNSRFHWFNQYALLTVCALAVLFMFRKHL